MKRWPIALVAGAAVLALLIAAAPGAVVDHAAPVAREDRARNAALLTALLAAGIEHAWVDAGDARVVVVYVLPEDFALEDAQAYVLGSSAVVSPGAEELVARTTAGSQWRVAAADVRAHQAGMLTAADLMTRVDRG